jgi:hypothetical protein
VLQQKFAVAPLAAAPSAAEVVKHGVDFKKKQKEKSQVESTRQSKEIQKMNLKKVLSPPISTLNQKKMSIDQKQDTVHVADMTVMSDNQFNTTHNDPASFNQFSSGTRRKVPKVKDIPQYKFQRLPESQTYWCIKGHL